MAHTWNNLSENSYGIQPSLACPWYLTWTNLVVLWQVSRFIFLKNCSVPEAIGSCKATWHLMAIIKTVSLPDDFMSSSQIGMLLLIIGKLSRMLFQPIVFSGQLVSMSNAGLREERMPAALKWSSLWLLPILVHTVLNLIFIEYGWYSNHAFLDLSWESKWVGCSSVQLREQCPQPANTDSKTVLAHKGSQMWTGLLSKQFFLTTLGGKYLTICLLLTHFLV